MVLRCKDPKKREKIALAMELACANPDIGYDQWQRDSLFNNIKGVGWDPSKTTKKVETDCSALVRVCIAYAYGRDLAGNIRTITEPAALVATGEFEKLTAEQYTTTSDFLRRGDILCTPVSGHTVVVLDNGAKVAASNAIKATEAARSKDNTLNRTYKTTCALNLRNGAGTKANAFGKDKRILVTLKKGATVRCYGYYTKVYGIKWLYVEATHNGVKYTGFTSGKYLRKV